MSEALAGAPGAVRTPPEPRRPLDRSAFSWALYEWARNPYVIVCNIYVFAPYVAVQIIGDPIEGQAQIADLNKWAGLAAAVLAPILGAAADRAGARKAPLALVTGLMVSLIALFWFIAPVGSPFPESMWFWLLLGVGVLFPLTEALHNAMLSRAAKPDMIARASGLGLALGNLAGVLILVFTLIFLAFPGRVDWPFLPAQPAFGLSAAAFEPERAVAVICALWFLVWSAPLFLFSHDTARGQSWAKALREGVGAVAATLRKLKDLGDVGRFLLARMLYTDAKTAMIVLGGVYVAGVMEWGTIEMILYGITMSVVAVGGGFVGGWLDEALGPKRAIQIALLACFAGLLAMVSVDKDTVFFVIATGTAPVWGAPFIDTASELILIAIVSVLAVFITSAYASSRTMMTKLSPPDMVGELFGLYALAGAATAWIGPMLVAAATRGFESQQIGFASLAILLLAGFVALLPVRCPGAKA